MSDDNEDLKLRDKFAISILQSMLSDSKESPLMGFMETFDDREDTTRYKLYLKMMERRIRASYKLADLMRKIRMSSFE
jgi:hypothetical protein